ncbi:MFS transporter [Stappia sediminis]|uniref:MFS transporter n=1 Tax=Stappia sediminis TaxID=2692190 RepID=UPI0028AE83BF|nr:MFS transporter [Stappia sediminis]
MAKPLGVAALLVYGSPALPLAVLTLPLYVYLPTFYAETIGLPLALVGNLLLAIRLVDAVSDPVFGLLADRLTPPGGRRRGWFALASLPTALAAFMLLAPPLDADPAYLLAWGLALSLGYTASIIPYAAWGAELSGDYHARSRIAAAREGLVVAGTLIAIAVPAVLTAQGVADQREALKLLGWFVLISLPCLALLAAGIIPEPRPIPERRMGFKEGLSHISANRPFLRLLIAFVLNGFANGLPATLFLFFVARALEAPDMQGPFLFIYFLCGIAGVPVWVAIAGKFGKHRTWSVAMVGACVVFACVPLLGPGDLAGFGIICVLTGFALGADLVLPASIQADVIDVDTASSGARRAGLYFALWGLATKLSLALAVGLAFSLLEIAGFEAQGSGRTGVAMLVALYAILPVALKFAAIALMWSFPLDKSAQEDLQRRIAG